MTKMRTVLVVLCAPAQQVSMCLKTLLRREEASCSPQKAPSRIVNTADNHPRLSAVFLHRIDLDFKPVTVKMFCNLDFQYRTNFGVTSNKSFRKGSTVISRVRIFTTWAWWAISNVGNGNKELSSRDISDRTSVITSFRWMKVFWQIFEFLFVLPHQVSSRSWNSDWWCGEVRYVVWDLRRGIIIHFRNKCPRSLWEMSFESPSKFLAPIRDGFVNTKLIGGDNDA